MIRYLIKQPLRVWRSLGWRTKTEALILVTILFLYPAGKLQILFSGWLSEGLVTPWGLTLCAVHIFLLSIFISGPFILLYLVGRQKAVHVFYTRPLERRNVLFLIGYYALKYQLLNLFLIAPVIWALAWSAGWYHALWGASLFLVYAAGGVIFQIELLNRSGKKFRFVVINSVLIVFHSATWIVVYIRYTPFIWLLEGIALLSLIFISVVALRSAEEILLEKMYPPVNDFTIQAKTHRAKSHPLFRWIPLPPVLNVLFRKEWFSMWRNQRYRRLKRITIAMYVICLLPLHFSAIEFKEIWMLILTLAIIWIHYSNSFNEKYVQPDPVWYLFTLPLKYHQIWISKFIAEFFAVILMILLFWATLLVQQIDIITQFYLILTAILFSVFVLASMINFKMMFYDDPRLAGYAFHFLILFIVIMSLNFRFVGPVTGLVLMLYYTYKSYRYFKA